ncbi:MULTISPECIES: RidA family protein [Bacillaceae]|uniref:RidA family protein n=1 Tax=Bacillaceae TaxID=186817 RepID=UPI000597101C|nr:MULTISPECIES: RidA family protein [Bacillus]KIL74018.1 putative translation initiation inhibitor, yjgF family [Bacillus badius]RJS61838.1 RidA family protein [Bacillus sp. PK3_68]UAT32826.1 RidA family protein [Bacillus badius]GLY11879.1 enamine deaminase RidA [Bacillus badius]
MKTETVEIKRFRKFETNKFYPSHMGEESHHVANEFSMVVRAGNRIFMRGQTAFDLDGNFHGENDVIAQTENACRCIKQLLEEAGGKMTDVCKLTTYVTDRNYRKDVYSVIAKHFKGVYPVSTGLVVNGLALPEMLVEIDVEAIISDDK